MQKSDHLKITLILNSFFMRHKKAVKDFDIIDELFTHD